MMGRILGALLGRARKVESQVMDSVERASQRLTQSGERTPLEIAHAIVDAVEAQVHISGRGRRRFTASDIRVTVVAPSRDARDRFDAVFDGPMPLRDRILDRLDSLDCFRRA